MPRWKNIVQSRDEVHRLKRAAVLREANRIINRQGFHRTSLDDIAEALHVSKGTLYNYVHDKQEILFECQMMGLDLGDRAVDFAVARGMRGYDKLRLLLRAFTTWLNSQEYAGGVMTDVSALRPDDRKVVVARRDAIQAQLVALVEEGMADDSIRPVDPRIAIYAAMTAINATPSWYHLDGRLSPEAVADRLVDVLASGIRAPDYIAQPDLPIAELTDDVDVAPKSDAGRRSQREMAHAVGRRRSLNRAKSKIPPRIRVGQLPAILRKSSP